MQEAEVVLMDDEEQERENRRQQARRRPQQQPLVLLPGEELPVAMPLPDDMLDDDSDDDDAMDDGDRLVDAHVMLPPNIMNPQQQRQQHNRHLRHLHHLHRRQLRRHHRDNIPMMNNGPAAPVVLAAAADAVDVDGDEEDPFLQLEGREAAATSFLHGMIKDPETTCTSVLGWGSRGCNHVVERCRTDPDDVFFHDVRNGRTPLHEACLRCSCLHVVTALLEVHAGRVMVTDGAGNTPLHLLLVGVATRAMDAHDMGAMIDKLLAAENPTVLASMGNRHGNTCLHMACSAPETMIHIDSFQKILNANPASAARLNTLSQTPLSLHCQRRCRQPQQLGQRQQNQYTDDNGMASSPSQQVARLLLQAYPNAINILDTAKGCSPLHYACENANYDLIQMLLEQDSEAASLRTTTQLETPLHLFLCRKNSHGEACLPALQNLLQADPDAVLARDATKGYTPLHLVCRSARVPCRVVELLVADRPEAASIRDSNHYLPIHHACELGAGPEVISCLLEAYPEGAKAMTKKNDSALSLACACNKSTETVALLIQANAGALTERNHYGFVPLHCVCGAVQPRVGIVEAILEVCPESVTMKSHGGETPMHIASGNPGTFVGVIELLTAQYEKNLDDETARSNFRRSIAEHQQQKMTNKVGNTPLHHACFRGSPFEHIETLAMSNPHWVKCPNNAGYTALQIMCKNARLNDRVITTFSRIGGPGVFSITDLGGNTPLHSSMREETDIEALRCLIRAYPDALCMKTAYGDTPLHLATTRRVSPEVVREIAISSSESLLLTPNTAGQTPVGIAMEEFENVCKSNCASCAKSDYLPSQQRAFDVLATLVKILHYGSSPLDDRDRAGSLVRACMSLHRRDVRLAPAFILRALHLYPEEARMRDEYGNYPLHIEASIPVEKMSLLSVSGDGFCAGGCHKRMNILRVLFDIYPAACRVRNHFGEFPLGLMIQNGRAWDQTFALILRSFPQALHWSMGVNNKINPLILSKVARECGTDILYTLINSRPDIATRVKPAGDRNVDQVETNDT